jgi:lipid-binding SYLF domain-containing protein
MTDWKMRAEVLTYSRARGVFAGLTLNGAAIYADDDSTRSIYGRRVPTRTILMGRIETPADSVVFTNTVAKYAAQVEAESKPAAAPAPAPAKSK